MAVVNERRCGSCKFWVPEKEGLVERARSKYPWPHCELEKAKGIDGPKSADSKPCMVWMPKNKGKQL